MLDLMDIKNFFNQRTMLEKILVCIIIIFASSLIGVVVHYPSVKTETKLGLICENESCKKLASAILKSLNQNVDPCEDFYSFTCDGWIKSKTIPEDTGQYGITEILREDIIQKIHDLLINEANFSNSFALKNSNLFFESCMDTDGIELRNNTPILKLLNYIGGWPIINNAELSEANYDFLIAMAKIQRITSYGFVVLIRVGTDSKNTSGNILQLDKASFSISEDILLDSQNTAFTQKQLQNYKNFFTKILQLFNPTDKTIIELEKNFDDIIQFERSLAEFTTRKMNNLEGNRMKIKELRELCPQIDWLIYIRNVTNFALNNTVTNSPITENDEIIVQDLNYIKKVSEFLGEGSNNATFTQLVMNYLGWRLVVAKILHLPKKFFNVLQEYSRNSGYNQIIPKRWKMCTITSMTEFGPSISAMYINKYFPEEVKNEIMKLVLDIKFQFEITLKNSSWMDKSTTKAALTKLRLMKTNIAYPYWMSDFDLIDDNDLKTEKPNMTMDLFENGLMLSQYTTKQTILKLREINNDQEWIRTPITVNAGYNKNKNMITFPAAFLQEPLFVPKVPTFYNYAAIGSIIGHEITHGFDNEGRKRNASGHMQNWWSENSEKEFIEKAKCFVAQYNNYKINGLQTLAENIADNGGLRQSYSAYLKWKNSTSEISTLPYLEKFSIDQQFFIAYGTIWCAKYKEKALNSTILYDEHAPSRYRVMGTIENMPAFSEAFRCPVKNKNNFETPCVIW